MPDTPSAETIRAALDHILPRVQRPSRYLGLERNLIRKPWDAAAVRVALTFPDAYEIGMSHQGSQILYNLINRRPDALAERAYAPMPDMAGAMREAGVPLYTLESYRAVRDFGVAGISLQTELNYSNVPYLLDLAGIPRYAADRDANDPLVIGGGPCTANPEPVADFFDALLIGDAETGLDAVLDCVREAHAGSSSRLDLLRRLASVPGVYVPQLFAWRGPDNESGEPWEVLDPAATLPIRRVWVERLDPADQPERPIVPFAEVIQDRLGMEIMRGCTQGCRFCQAGYWYRPVREHDPATVLDRIEKQVGETGFDQVGLLSLSTADYSQVEPLVYNLAERLQSRRVSLSLPSLRADAFSVGLAKAVSRVRRSGFTFAPETGSDRLRRVINKTFTNADMIRAAEAAFKAGWDMIKVYAMIGLPTETDDDLEDLARLSEELLKVGRGVRGRRVQVKISVGCFVPKAWTPFQWQEFVPVAEQRRRIDLLKGRFRRMRGARLTWSDPEEAALEALLSRGDRRLAATISRAYDLGAVFDGWSDHLDLEAWRRAMDDTGVDLEAELGPRDMAQALPWDLVDAGVRKSYLRAEWRRAQKETATADCKWGECVLCGIPGDGADTQLAPQSLPMTGLPLASDEQPKAAAYALRPEPRMPEPPQQTDQAAVYRRYRITYSKRGDARFLSHRQVMDALERALRAAAAPVRYTEGFNPHIRLSMGPALAVGHEGLAEVFDVDCVAPLRRHQVTTINGVLPDGVEILDARDLLAGAPSLGKLAAAARYRIAPWPGLSWPDAAKGMAADITGGVLSWSILADGSLRVDLNLRAADAPAPTVKTLLSALGVDEHDLPAVRVLRELVLLRPARTKAEQKEARAS